MGPPSADSALCLPHHTASANGSPFLFLPGRAPDLSFFARSMSFLPCIAIVITLALRLSGVDGQCFFSFFATLLVLLTVRNIYSVSSCPI